MTRALEKQNAVAQAVPVRVAMVEDEREIRDSWVKLLGTFPDFACVCTCASGEDALKQLPSIRPQIVLMDIFLPRMSGIECTAKLKELLPNAHILILTSVADDELVFMALQAGADGYLLKSTQPAELEAALRDLLRGGAPMTGAVARRVVRYFRQKKKPKDTALGLSTREEEVLILLSKGYGNKEIAADSSRDDWWDAPPIRHGTSERILIRKWLGKVRSKLADWTSRSVDKPALEKVAIPPALQSQSLSSPANIQPADSRTELSLGSPSQAKPKNPVQGQSIFPGARRANGVQQEPVAWDESQWID